MDNAVGSQNMQCEVCGEPAFMRGVGHTVCYDHFLHHEAGHAIARAMTRNAPDDAFTPTNAQNLLNALGME